MDRLILIFDKVKERLREIGFSKRSLVSIVVSAIILTIAFKSISIIATTPDIDMDALYGYSENSKFIDSNGKVIGQSVGSEFRSYIGIEDLPDHVKNAFIAIEDKRFYKHRGVDLYGIAAATFDNIKSGKLVRGASTITQQLIKNTHLSSERSLDRKIKEAFLSMKLERMLSKDKILEAYLNNTSFGQGAIGIESASNIYFSKSAKDLTIEEAAILAGIVQSPSRYAPYKRIEKKDVDYEKDIVLSEIVVGGSSLTCIYHPEFEDRRDLVLKEMYRQKHINKEAYDKAVNTPSLSLIKPSSKVVSDQMYYLSDFIKQEASKKIMEITDYSYEKANHIMNTSGYTVKTSIDMEIQSKLDSIYANRNNVNALLEKMDFSIDPNTKNLVNSKGRVIYYHKDNIVDSKGWFYLDKGDFEVRDGGLFINSDKIETDDNNIYYKDYYSISDNGDLYIHNIDRTNFDDRDIISKDNTVFISKAFLDENPDFFINNGEVLKINDKYYDVDIFGKKQPDVSSVVVNPKSGMIIGMFGSSNTYVNASSNQATNHRFSPMRHIRPFSIFYPKNTSMDSYISKSMIDSETQFSSDSFRELRQDGLGTILESLEKFQIIDKENPLGDSFVSRDEDDRYNDEGSDALVYGRFQKGLNLVDLAKAYGVLASEESREIGVITEILDRDGKVIYSNKDREVIDMDEEAKYMTKMLFSNNKHSFKNHSMITNNRGSITAYGSNDIVILSMINNNYSKLQFRNNISSNIINYAIEDIFSSELSSSEFVSPNSIPKMEICSISGLIANESCINANLSYTEYGDTKPEGVCSINHSGDFSDENESLEDSTEEEDDESEVDKEKQDKVDEDNEAKEDGVKEDKDVDKGKGDSKDKEKDKEKDKDKEDGSGSEIDYKEEEDDIEEEDDDLIEEDVDDEIQDFEFDDLDWDD